MIYLVEDDNSIRELVIYTLQTTGFEAKGFACAKDFWNEMKKEEPSLVLLDIMLPDEDGLSILRKLRDSGHTSRLPVIMLTAKGSGGGIEVIGIWMAKKYAGMSVGKLGTIFNLILYAIYLLVFDISTVIYSVVYLFFYTVTLDRMHFQNINVRMLIFTKKKGIAEAIMKETGRGVTQWNGEGAFTSEHNYVLVTIVNKFEVEDILNMVYLLDPEAFTTVDEGVKVYGNFQKRV